MKKFLESFAGIIGIVYKILPFFLGMYCYYPYFKNSGSSIYPFFDTAYASLKLYSGCTESGITVNATLELARFLALAATLSILIKAFNKLQDIADSFKQFSSDSTAVYGNSVYADHLYESLSPFVRVRSDGKGVKHAAKHILMLSGDKENLRFYNENYSKLKGRKVYIMLEDTSRQNVEDPMITVFSIPENCARHYWKQFPVEHSEKIAIIGFDSIGQNMLIYGLQMNLIDPSQHFEYHIYGDGSEFRRLHTELDKMLPDEIFFCDSGIYELDELSKMDRIIICGNENDNISVVGKFLELLPNCPKLYVYAPNGDIFTKLFGAQKVHCFGLACDTASIDMILNEKSMEDARRQHEYYAAQYGGVSWDELDCFKRYSNVSSADYMFMIKKLSQKNIPLETIAELEHMRWCRYHFLHNWKYGAQRNDKERIHNCLVPFADLSEEEKQKDIEAIKSKL